MWPCKGSEQKGRQPDSETWGGGPGDSRWFRGGCHFTGIQNTCFSGKGLQRDAFASQVLTSQGQADWNTSWG
eukprot:3473529-Alexandrium_andersonii.AAC.1